MLANLAILAIVVYMSKFCQIARQIWRFWRLWCICRNFAKLPGKSGDFGDCGVYGKSLPNCQTYAN